MPTLMQGHVLVHVCAHAMQRLEVSTTFPPQLLSTLLSETKSLALTLMLQID